MNENSIEYILNAIVNENTICYNFDVYSVIRDYKDVIYKYKYDKYNMNDDDIYQLSECIGNLLERGFHKHTSYYDIRKMIASKIQSVSISTVSNILSEFNLLTRDDVNNIQYGNLLIENADELEENRKQEQNKLDDSIVSKINDYLENKVEKVVERIINNVISDKIEEMINLMTGRIDTIINNKLKLE